MTGPNVRHDGELFRRIPGYERFYAVSRTGRVLSLPRKFSPARRILSPANGRYARVCLSGAKRQTYCVHYLVTLAYLGPRPPGLEVCHNDGDSSNNRLSNLRYATKSENERDKERHGTCLRGVLSVRAVLDPDSVRWIREMAPSMSKRAIAEHLGCSTPTVWSVLSGRTWGHVQ